MPIGNIKLVSNEIDLRKIEFGKEYDSYGLYYFENWVNVEVNLFNISGMILVFPFNNRKYEFFYRKKGKDKFYFGNEYLGKFCVIYFEGNGNFIFNVNMEKNNIYQIDNLFLSDGFQKFYLSQDLIHMRSKVKQAYGLEYNYNSDDSLLIFGMYNPLDVEILKKNEKAGVLWGGSDIMLEKPSRQTAIEIIKERNIVNYAMSLRIYDKLIELGVKNIKRVVVSFCWNDLRYLTYRDNNAKKRAIYIYDGMDKGKKKKIIYNQDMVDKIVEILEKDYKIYRSSDGFREDVMEMYKESFVSLRLTEYDGNANSAQECGMLGIPVISNQEMNHCVSWNRSDEIISKVRFIFDNNIRIFWNKSKINIMFISCDLPGKGGGATFTGNLADYLRNRGFNIWEVYLVHSDKQDIEIKRKRVILRFHHKKKWDLIGLLDKIGEKDERFKIFLGNCKVFLRSSVGDLRRLRERFKVIFMSPGIYKNEMGKDFDVKYINASNIKTASVIDTYANSRLTQSIFHKFGLNDVGCLEINLLQLRDYYGSTERDIDFLFVVSNVERKIKNAKLFIDLAKKMGKKFMLISADKLKNNYSNIEVVINPKKLDEYYRRSKFLINCSYFDSMSNVVLEGLNHGCHIVVSENNGIAEYIGADLRDKFIIEGYDLKDWEEKLGKLLLEWENMENHRKKLWDDLRKKSWEVELRLQVLLAV